MPATLDDVLKLGQDMVKRQDAIDKKIEDAQKRRNTGAAVAGVPDGPPAVRRGDSALSSRGFRMGKMLAAISNPLNTAMVNDAKNEIAYSQRLCEKMRGKGWNGDNPSSQLMPLWPEAFSEEDLTNDEYKEMYEYLGEGVQGADHDEMRWLGKRWDFYGVHTSGIGYRGKAATAASPAQSWVDTSIGGGFVPPPMFGPPIELLRNKEALLRAGATTVPLGPSGRIQMPRLTSATQGGWAGENIVQTPVNAGTGLMTLSAKKVIALVAFPNELLRFGSPAAEAMIRNDLFKTVALIADKGYLEGVGSDIVPLGLATMGSQSVSGGAPSAGQSAVNTAGMNVVTPTNTGQLAPQDFYEFMAAIEENNEEATGWIMRPKMYYAAQKSRWTPYSGGTAQGGFVFDNMRSIAEQMPGGIAGLPVTRSVQVSKTRGSGSQTYVLCGNWPDYLVGLFGAIEFTQSNQGFNLLSADQTLVRAILTTDGGPRHPGLFSFCDSLNFVIQG